MIDVPTLQAWIGDPSASAATALALLEPQVVALAQDVTDRYWGPPAPLTEVINGSGRPEVFLREAPVSPGAPITVTAGAAPGSLSLLLASVPAGLGPRQPLLLTGAQVSETVTTALGYAAGANPVALAPPGVVNAGQTAAAYPALSVSWRRDMQQAPVPFAPPSSYGLPATPGDYEVWGRKLLMATVPAVLGAGLGYRAGSALDTVGWPRGVKNLVFAYTAGYAPNTEPPAIRLAVTALCAIFYARRGSAALLARESDGTVSRDYRSAAGSPAAKFLDQFPEIKLALDAHRRRAMGGRL